MHGVVCETGDSADFKLILHVADAFHIFQAF